jgi:hypothetical protein
MGQLSNHEEFRPEISQSHQGSPEPSAEQIYRQMEMILGADRFRQAKSLENFLRHVVTRKLDGAENELKEYTIGLEVFRRGADYDPRRDAVVRVQANVLRKRLASYYEEEGADDKLIIEMPKGHYVPRFYFRSGIAGLDTQVTAQATPAGQGLSRAQSLLALPRVAAPWLITTTFILGLMTAFAFQHWQSRRILAQKNVEGSPQPSPSTTADPVYLPLWEKFFESGVENLLAYGTPQFFSANGVYLRDVEINSPQEGAISSRLRSLRKASHLNLQPTEIYTGVGETHGVYLLTRFFNKAARELRVTRSRTVGWNEMKNANVIFLSSMRFHTLAKDMPYPSDFVINPGIKHAIVNLRPEAGEAASYGGRDGDEYATLTVWPGKLHQRRIMLLNGSTTWATLAAAEYVTDPEYLRQLNQHLEKCRLKAGAERHAPYFQALLRAEVKDNQPISISYVTHHDLQIADQAEANLPDNQQVMLRRQ